MWSRDDQGDDAVLFATSGGRPKRARLYSLAEPPLLDAEDAHEEAVERLPEERCLLFTAERGEL